MQPFGTAEEYDNECCDCQCINFGRWACMSAVYFSLREPSTKPAPCQMTPAMDSGLAEVSDISPSLERADTMSKG